MTFQRTGVESSQPRSRQYYLPPRENDNLIDARTTLALVAVTRSDCEFSREYLFVEAVWFANFLTKVSLFPGLGLYGVDPVSFSCKGILQDLRFVLFYRCCSLVRGFRREDFSIFRELDVFQQLVSCYTKE